MNQTVRLSDGSIMAFEVCPTGCPQTDLVIEERSRRIADDRMLREFRVRCSYCGMQTKWHPVLTWAQMLWNTGRRFEHHENEKRRATRCEEK